MLNTGLMKLITYILFGILSYYSYKDFNRYIQSKSSKNDDELGKYIHSVEIRIGIALFFITTNILLIASHI